MKTITALSADTYRKGEDFDEKQDRDIEYIENWINNYPRGIFGFKTSAQLFEEEIRKLA